MGAHLASGHSAASHHQVRPGQSVPSPGDRLFVNLEVRSIAKLHPFKYAAEELPDLSSCMQPQCLDPHDHVKQWLLGFLNMRRKQPTGGLLMTLNEAIA